MGKNQQVKRTKVEPSFNNVNVLLVMSDQHKKSASGVYGHKVIKTPVIDALAKSGITFNNAYTPAPVCAPARAAMQTGMYPHSNGAIYHKAPHVNDKGKEVQVGAGEYRDTGYHTDIQTMAELFRSQGYITAAPGKMHVHGELQKSVDDNYPEGNDLGYQQTSLRYYTHFPGKQYSDEVGMDTYHRYAQKGDYKKNGGPQDLNWDLKPSLVENDEQNFDMMVANRAVEFIAERGKDKQNFFLHVGFEKPHLPLTTLKRFYDMYDADDFQLPDTVNDWYEQGRYPWIQDWVHNGIPKKDPEAARKVMAAYAACITEMDEMFGRVIQSLKDSGLYDNTVIIYSTDHGEHMFEHGLRGKHNMYDAAINIPFIVSYPQELPQNQFNESMVSLIDIMPTVAELIGAQVPSEVEGISLVEVMKKQQQLTSRPVFTEYRQGGYKAFKNARFLPSRMMRKGDFKFIYTHNIIHQMYNVKQDPDELVNLAMDPKFTIQTRQMAFETIAQWRFEKYAPIETTFKDDQLQWQPLAQAARYHIFYSKDNSPANASEIASGIKGNEYQATQPGYYWVMADVALTRTSKRLGDTPVWAERHSYRLPVSDATQLKSSLQVQHESVMSSQQSS